jgi:hypothetical protein
MIHTMFRTLVVAAPLFAVALPAAAADLPKEGRFDFNYCMAGKTDYTELKSGLATGMFEGWAATYANGGTRAFDRQGSRCVGVYEIIDGKYRDYGVCTQVDADGDKWLMRFETGGDMGGKWVVVGGSGKYDGMTGSATYVPVGEIPPGAAPGIYNKCNRNTGTYRMK